MLLCEKHRSYFIWMVPGRLSTDECVCVSVCVCVCIWMVPGRLSTDAQIINKNLLKRRLR